MLGMKHFKVQLIGGIILHQGRIAEMKTGEGKTLVVTLPAYLNALSGKGVHIITVNDYLATYHSAWMGKLYKFLGLTVGLVVPGMTPEQKQMAYASDITYGTNNEFGFDYLRDNMCMSRADMVQRDLHYAVVDEPRSETGNQGWVESGRPCWPVTPLLAALPVLFVGKLLSCGSNITNT